VHRFTLIKLGLTTKRVVTSAAGGEWQSPPATQGWSSLDSFFFPSGMLPGGGAKYYIYTKRLEAVLEWR